MDRQKLTLDDLFDAFEHLILLQKETAARNSDPSQVPESNQPTAEWYCQFAQEAIGRWQEPESTAGECDSPIGSVPWDNGDHKAIDMLEKRLAEKQAEAAAYKEQRDRYERHNAALEAELKAITITTEEDANARLMDNDPSFQASYVRVLWGRRLEQLRVEGLLTQLEESKKESERLRHEAVLLRNTLTALTGPSVTQVHLPSETSLEYKFKNLELRFETEHILVGRLLDRIEEMERQCRQRKP